MSEMEIIESLKKLILEVNQKQKELSQVIHERSKGILSPSLVQLTDPSILLEEKQLIDLVETGPSDTSLKFQETFKELMQRCEIKNKMISGLIDDLKNNFNWKSITSCSSEDDSLKNSKTSRSLQNETKKVEQRDAAKKRKPPKIPFKNPIIGICPECKRKIKPRKICKKCGEVENQNGKHLLKCIDCGNEVVERKTCSKCYSLEQREIFSSCQSSQTTVKPGSKENFATLAVPEFSLSSFHSFSDKDLKFLREPKESFMSATIEEISSYESLSMMQDVLPEYADPSEESFLKIKMQEQKKFEDDEKSIEKLGSTFVKLSNEIQENLADLMAKLEVSGDHPAGTGESSVIPPISKSAATTPPQTPPKTLPETPSKVDEVNEDFDVEVYNDTDVDDDTEDYKSTGEIPIEIKELIKSVTEYDKLPQIPSADSDLDLFHDIIEEEEPRQSDGEETYEEFEEIFPYNPGLNMISIPSSASFQTALRLLVAKDNPKTSFIITPLHSVGKITSILPIQTASFVNLSLHRSQSRACILLFVKQNIKIPFVEILEAPRKKFASLAVARAQTLHPSQTISLFETNPSRRIEIRHEPTKVEIKKLMSPNQAAIFETEKALIFAGIEFKEKWQTVSIENSNEDDDPDAYLDAEDLPFPDELFGISKRVETAQRESDEGMYESTLDFVRKIKPKAKAPSEVSTPVLISDESEERLDKLLRLLSQLEKAIKESEIETSSSTAADLVREIGKSVETLGKISSDISRVERIFESDSMEILETDSDQKLKRDMQEELIDTKRSIYEELESEASEMEKRVEKDFDRIDRLIRENDESIKFVEAFIEKTARRASEFDELKREIAHLQREIEILIDTLEESRNNVKTRYPDENPEVNTADVQSTTSDVVNDAIQSTTVKDTISILMDDLDKLKNKAKEKNERCKEIFGERFVLPEQAKPLTGLEKTKSSFTMKRAATSILEFKNVGFNSFYLSWSKPENPTADAILGYEILVNGKINQKVRNPDRLQTVLYTVEPEEKTEVKLYGLTKLGLMLLGEVTYLN